MGSSALSFLGKCRANLEKLNDEEARRPRKRGSVLGVPQTSMQYNILPEREDSPSAKPSYVLS